MKRLKTIVGIAAIAVLSFSIVSFTNPTPQKIMKEEQNVTITISSDTSDDNLKEISNMMKDNNIEVTFSNIKRNDEGLITGIKIELKDTLTNNKSVSNLSSSVPIQEITFGRKNGGLFITQGRGITNFSSGRGNRSFISQSPSMNRDSMRARMQKHFKMFEDVFEFNEKDNTLNFNGRTFKLDEMDERMKQMFDIEEDENGNKRFIMKRFSNHPFFDRDDENDVMFQMRNGRRQKYQFTNDPNIEKLIIIDGKESNFKTLDKLAKDNKLDTVDMLKPKTAQSIYGKKAKDGAVIATTKQ